MSDSSVNISVQEMKRVDLVTVSGRVDSSNAAQLDETLKGIMERGQHNIVLDLSGIEYISSAGLRVLVSALRTCKKHLGDVRIAAPSERVNEVLSLAGLDALFQTFTDATTAVGSY